MDVPIRNQITPMANVPRLDLEVQVHKMVVEAFTSFDNLQVSRTKPTDHWALGESANGLSHPRWPRMTSNYNGFNDH